MYYRRKIILAILEAFGGSVGKIDLQKLLLLFTKYQSKPSFEFVPHRYGCYSFQSRLDMRALKTYGIINDTSQSWLLKASGEYLNLLTKPDQAHLAFLKQKYSSYTTQELIRETYLQYPYYAIRSEIGPRVLDPDQWSNIVKIAPEKHNTTLYTIGYEGISIEAYFNRLIVNDIKVLCDVRRNPISQKPGFSKSELQHVCEVLNIQYIHKPELGIPSNKRQNLQSQQEYNALFADYRSNYLPSQADSIHSIYDLVINKKRVALTCFEASYVQCHRSQVANAVTQLPECQFNLTHL